jgi:CelD/BcsL family acetyltransferase involved in cellulose biosynthesis
MTNVRVLDATELTPELESAWAEIQRGDPLFKSPFFHPQFTRIVAAARDDVHIAVLGDDDDPAGFFPFQRDRRAVGHPVGWGLNDYQGVVARRDLEWTARELIRACGLRWFEFDHVPAEQGQFARHRSALAASPAITIAGGFARYEREQGEARSKTLKRLRSRRRRLLRWKSARYESTGAADLLRRPWFRAVVEAAFAASAEGFACPLSVLWAGERPVAMHLGPRSRSVWHYWLPAHDDDPELARTSPGMLMILAMAEHAAELGVTVLDFGRGDARHKREFANSEVALAEGWVSTPSTTAAGQWLRRSGRVLARRSGLGPRLRRLRAIARTAL